MNNQQVVLTPSQIAELPRYDATNPSGVYPGKCWLCLLPAAGMTLKWYGEELSYHPGHLPVRVRLLVDRLDYLG